MFLFLLISIPLNLVSFSSCNKLPVVINTWGFTDATEEAWKVLTSNGSALDAVEAGCRRCETDQCDGTVGFGGSPDENGETTLDALIIDGPTHSVGSVAALRRIKSAISVARKVMEHTRHTLLVGDQATQFAISMGFKEETLSTNHSKALQKSWKENNCQPNFWKNVEPDPSASCGPYHPGSSTDSTKQKTLVDEQHHDTIGMLAIDSSGKVAAGTSTNGAIHKIPGRVGDSPIAGSGAYADQDVGAAAATGDGDIMMRFLPSYQAVESMRLGMDPLAAAEEAMKRIVRRHPDFSGAVVALTINGTFGASCHGIKEFPFSVANLAYGSVVVKKISCI